MEAHLKANVIVVSAVNFSDGGPLTVLRDCLDAACELIDEKWTIIALVHRRELITNPRVQCLEYPDSKNSWLSRLRLEWFEFHTLSKKLKPSLWLSLHDITPRVVAQRRVVYCHNPAPFYRLTLEEIYFEPKLLLFRLLYKHLYRLNIHRNAYVVVQQEWIRSAFRTMYGHKSLVVAHPELRYPAARSANSRRSDKTIFLYPALARVFKNFEILCRAVQSLPREIVDRLELRLTIDGTENRYARHLLRRFGATHGISFIGRQRGEAMLRQYEESDILLFPSKLETWGLPISEAKALGKPMLVADLPYARETVGNYAAVSFVPVDDEKKWRDAIAAAVAGSWCPEGGTRTSNPKPYSADWQELWGLLIDGLDGHGDARSSRRR